MISADQVLGAGRESSWRSRRLVVLLIVGFIGFAAAGVRYIIFRTEPTAFATANAIATLRPTSLMMPSTVTTSGIVRLRTGASVRVGSQVSGIVRKLNVTVGSSIRRGQVIAEIDPNQLQARVDQARAQLRIDRVQVSKAERDVGRTRSLAAAGAIPRQQQEDLNWQLESAKAKADKSESDLKAATVELSYCVIRAPISGIIASVGTQEGETVAASFAAPTFVTIVEQGALELLAMVDETDIAGVAPGNPIKFTVEAYSGKEFGAEVQRIDPTATIVSGVVNYPVIARIEAQQSLLRPDMTANIVIETAQRSALAVPSAAIEKSSDGARLYVRIGDRVEPRLIALGARQGEFTEILKGLAVNEDVLERPPPANFRAAP